MASWQRATPKSRERLALCGRPCSRLTKDLCRSWLRQQFQLQYGLAVFYFHFAARLYRLYASSFSSHVIAKTSSGSGQG
ncbi:hypothetical protein BDW59DRAFT_150043 [Aspergillus cavernicola]|uniref:Uncharacterized protein n=1 Tax=Aspergillus cavernicola TaxID=176166 RepID=A0ABR4I220_9EURO